MSENSPGLHSKYAQLPSVEMASFLLQLSDGGCHPMCDQPEDKLAFLQKPSKPRYQAQCGVKAKSQPPQLAV